MGEIFGEYFYSFIRWTSSAANSCLWLHMEDLTDPVEESKELKVSAIFLLFIAWQATIGQA